MISTYCVLPIVCARTVSIHLLQLLLRRVVGQTFVENTVFRGRIQLAVDNDTAIGVEINGVQKSDVGLYAIYVPTLNLYNSQMMLFVTGKRLQSYYCLTNIGASFVISLLNFFVSKIVARLIMIVLSSELH